jgi:hypothetical protein
MGLWRAAAGKMQRSPAGHGKAGAPLASLTCAPRCKRQLALPALQSSDWRDVAGARCRRRRVQLALAAAATAKGQRPRINACKRPVRVCLLL